VDARSLVSRILEGPGELNVNAGLAKQIPLTEGLQLRFEATFTKVLNHPNFAPPALNVSNQSTFGVLTNTLPQGLGGNRTGQLALRLDFWQAPACLDGDLGTSDRFGDEVRYRFSRCCTTTREDRSPGWTIQQRF